MRERLLAALLGLTLLTVLLYGVPRAVVRASVVEEEARREVSRSAQAVAEVVSARLDAGRSAAGAPLEFLDDGDQVLLTTAAGVEVLAGPEQPVGGDGAVGVRQAVGDGAVEVRRARSVVRQDIGSALLPILLTGLLALAVAGIAAVMLSARLARPFQRLAASAGSLGDGRAVELPPQPVREAEAIAAALRSGSARVERTLQREREFARNASHQLRTPLTGMRLRVEDAATWPETPDSVREELGDVLVEIDRLAGTVSSLLAFAREERIAEWEELSPALLLTDAAARWRPLARERGRDVALGAAADPAVLLPRVTVDQVLDVLVDNALEHGSGQVRLGARVDDDAVRFTVGDEGSLVGAATVDGLFRTRRGEPRRGNGEGIGLALCSDLAKAAGGRLSLAGRAPTTFELALPLTGA